MDPTWHLPDQQHLSRVCASLTMFDQHVPGMGPVVLHQFSAMSVGGGILALRLCRHVNVHVLLL